MAGTTREVENLGESSSSFLKRKLVDRVDPAWYMAARNKRIRRSCDTSVLDYHRLLSSLSTYTPQLHLNSLTMGNPYSSLSSHAISSLVPGPSFIHPLLVQPGLSRCTESMMPNLNSVAGHIDGLKSLPLSKTSVSFPMIPNELQVSSKQENFSSFPLAIDEDSNWLSEFQCFLRADFIEIFAATDKDVHIRNTSKKVRMEQVGIRCRFCAAKCEPETRAVRSSAFPSSVRQIYQSFTMMVRDHFEKCTAIPPEQKTKFLELRKRSTQGTSNAKSYWVYAAKKAGMEDSDCGIIINADSQAAGKKMKSFRSSPLRPNEVPVPFVLEYEDYSLASGFLCTLMSQLQSVNLADSERIGKRSNLPVGLPGLGCKYCCKAGRFGNSREFASRRCALPHKVHGMLDHFQRCTLCPKEMKVMLNNLHEADLSCPPDADKEKEFFDRLWTRLCRGG